MAGFAAQRNSVHSRVYSRPRSNLRWDFTSSACGLLPADRNGRPQSMRDLDTRPPSSADTSSAPTRQKGSTLSKEDMRGNSSLNVLITGASSGIGEAVAERFRADGNAVFLTGRRAEPPAGVRANETYLSGDLTDEEFVARLVSEAVGRLGPLDTVVTCHGLQVDGSIVATAGDTATEVLDANLRSVLTVIKHAVPEMRKTGSQIVLVSSRFGLVGIPGQVLYSTAKGGLNMLGKGAALELAERQIRVNVAAPGLTMTPVIEEAFQAKDDPDAYYAQRSASIPLRRLAHPEEIAEAIYFLGSPASSYITGVVLPVDGGYTAS